MCSNACGANAPGWIHVNQRACTQQTHACLYESACQAQSKLPQPVSDKKDLERWPTADIVLVVRLCVWIAHIVAGTLALCSKALLANALPYTTHRLEPRRKRPALGLSELKLHRGGLNEPRRVRCCSVCSPGARLAVRLYAVVLMVLCVLSSLFSMPRIRLYEVRNEVLQSVV